MARPSPASADDGTTHDLAQWADRSHWFVLPLTGVVSFGVGLSLVFGLRIPFAGYAPLLLVVLGVGAIASAVAGVATRRVFVSPAPEMPARVISESWVICPSCSARSSASAPHAEPPPVRDAPPLSWLLPAHAKDSGPVSVGDSLWASWLPSSGTMPVELVGPVAETAYVPHREGTPQLYEEGEPVILDLPTAGGIAGAVGTAVTLENALENGIHPRGVSELEAIVAEVEETLPTPGPFDAGEGISVTDLTMDDVVLWEALNPTPPHLRTGAERAPAGPAERRATVGDVYGGVRCVDCRGAVVESGGSLRCFLCRRRLCGDCMEKALRTTEGGCCSYCAALQGYVVLQRSTRPRANSSVA
jgi:hypothetical protein